MATDDRLNYTQFVSGATYTPVYEVVSDNLLRPVHMPVTQLSEVVTLDDASRALLERIAVALEAMAGTNKRKSRKRKAG